MGKKRSWAAWLVAALVGAGLLCSSPATAQTRFRFPANDPQNRLFRLIPTIHVDQDPADGEDYECKDYQGRGFPWCYNGHRGTDYLLIWQFVTMDKYDVEVVAAADGEVIDAVDGNYDRCHAEGRAVSCDGHPMRANIVSVRHADGIVSRYVHLKKGSVKVAVGDKVTCGDVLGYVGSSGRSAYPHLHFEVQDKDGKTIDPFAGPSSQPTSYWITQEGPFGRPDDLCPGETRPPDVGVPGPDGGVAGDATADGASSDAGAASSASGCRLAAHEPPGAWPLWLLALGVVLWRASWRRRSP